MNESYLSIELDRIVITKNNPRVINEKSEPFVKLLESVRAQGVIVPVHVRSFPPGVQLIPKGPKDHYELLAGERRYRAAAAAGLKEIRAISHGDITDAEAFEITFAENFAREDLTPVEQGSAVAILLEKYEGDYTAAAAKLGKSEKWVRTRALIHTQLSDEWKEAIGKVSELAYLTTAHLGLVARLPEATQRSVAAHIKGHYQKYSVDELDKKIGDWMRLIAKAPFENNQCQNCPKRSGAQPGLFSDNADGDTGKNDKCLDIACWDKKEIDFQKKQFAELSKKYPDGLLAVATSWMEYGVDTKKLKKIFGKINDHYSFTKAKKKDKGSVPAYVVYGTGKGKVIYVRVKKQQSEKAAAGKPQTLKQLRAGLEQKRWTETIGRFFAKISKVPAVDRSNNASARFATALLIAAYGADSPMYGTNKGQFIAKAVEEYKKDPVKGEVMVFEQLWKNITHILKYRMNRNGCKDSVCQAKLIAALFDIDLDPIYKVACSEKEFAEPAEWQDLNANGTPKKTALKAGKLKKVKVTKVTKVKSE